MTAMVHKTEIQKKHKGARKLEFEGLQMMDKDALRQKLEEARDEMERQSKLLAEKDEEIERLRRIAEGKGHGDGLDTVYGIVSRLEKYNTEEVLFYAAQVLSELMETKDVAVYSVANRGYARLFSATSVDARKLGNSIEYVAMEDMCEALKAGRVYLNLDGKENRPLMASSIHAEGEMRVILMIWGIPSQRMTQDEANRLKVIGMLIQDAILHANYHMANFRSRNRLEGTNVLNEEAFMVLVSAFFEARDKGLTECSLLEVMTGYQDFEEASAAVACNIRQTDYMGMMRDGRFYVLLPNTDMENAKVVQERLKKQGYRSQLKEVEKIR